MLDSKELPKNEADGCSKRATLAKYCQLGALYSFLLYLLTFSFSIVARDFFPICCCVFILLYYALDAKNSALYCFDGKKYFLFFYAFLVCGVIFSQNIQGSLYVFAKHTFTSLALPFIALECVRTKRNFTFIVWILVITLVLQGVNGIYQYVTGYDFVKSIAINSGRLTGSFSDYRVGNYVALTLIPASAMYFILQEKFSVSANVKVYSSIAVFMLTFALFFPALFLMFFSYTRNAYITLLAAAVLYSVILRIFPWKIFIAVLVFGVGLVHISNIRLSFAVISKDGRWKLWEHAIEIFEKYPIFGAGIGQYNPTLRALELTQDATVLGLSHPHNIYLQFLCETGVVGTVCVLIFLLGIFYWAYKKLTLLRPALEEQGLGNYWKSLGLLWCGFGAFLASGLVGHNFFQRWWLALVMAYLGILISLIVQAERDSKSS